MKRDTSGLIQSTSDLDMFVLREDNREIDANHVKKIKKLMEESNDTHLHPIIVNSNLEVIDGQHRLMAVKELGLPIYYGIDDNYNPHKMISINTSQKPWMIDDYCKYWIFHGREDYLRLKEMARDLSFPLKCMLIWAAEGISGSAFSGLGATGSAYSSFKIGKFKFSPSQEKIDTMFFMKEVIGILLEKDISPKSLVYSGSFHKAARAVFIPGLLDQDRFISKLNSISNPITKDIHPKGYIKQLIDIYNYKARNGKLGVLETGLQVKVVSCE